MMKVWKYGDSINTDMLFPGKYCYTCSTIEEIKPHLLEDLDSTFAKDAKEGDIIFAGRNFGCGSSREQPVLGLKAMGIAAVVAESFARIFYRAAINQGLVLIENPDAVKAFTGEEDVLQAIDEVAHKLDFYRDNLPLYDMDKIAEEYLSFIQEVSAKPKKAEGGFIRLGQELNCLRLRLIIRVYQIFLNIKPKVVSQISLIMRK